MTAQDNPALAECQCGDDPQLQLLRDLLLRDVPQYDASLIAFGYPPRTTAAASVHRIWAGVEARRIANRARVELGLDEVRLLDPIPAVPQALSVRIQLEADKFIAGLKRLGDAVKAVRRVVPAQRSALAGE